ncbi:MAG: NUDIX hydrolase [Streptosporangiaceae bacterium]|jgi:8-oxo-dGTP pyrophosphatase MutT (NUDIX family)
MSFLPPQEYYASLPKHIASGAAIFHDPEGRFLLVKPSYRDTWELPGGGMDAGEYPLETAHREIREEIGLDVTLGRLLVIDWVPPRPDGRPALANFVFNGDALINSEAQQRIRLQSDELTAWRMAGPQEWDTLLPPHTARRMRACADALAAGSTFYLEHGWHPGAARPLNGTS